ncbi:hypothetical protein PsorP6_008393 [Peronosclerospora sorghi]|uniref:Uncharacterized protein n=1 Tax=Peronosclerospora sorghi TaxID=230839 RepID=A0ACC0W7D1_9STRA|nr:hypothetical protein PsorP6_008393 [Peronosclerospora sorghi]
MRPAVSIARRYSDTRLGGLSYEIKGASRKQRASKEKQRVASSEADEMLLALERHAVTRQYKRRVEWEVARRSARMDRELQQYFHQPKDFRISSERRQWCQRRLRLLKGVHAKI